MAVTATEINNLENRVLVFMPTGRDALLICQTLASVGIFAQACENFQELKENIAFGAGALLMAEEGLIDGNFESLMEVFERQPIWSDIPVVLFAGNAQSSEKLLATVGTRLNATIVERPIRITMFVSAVRGALRARERQYQSRNLLNQLEESDRQKDLFLATLSHELRTPLNSILGWIQMLNDENSRSQIDEKHALAVIERNARMQSEMISDILFVSRIITGKLELDLETIDLIAVLKSAIDILRPAFEAKQITVQTALDSGIGEVEGDSARLQQVFCNLLSNAVKFTPQHGQIGIKMTAQKSTVEIEVSDSGRGIEPQFLPYVFERFRQADNSYTRQIGGLGLGLAIVRHLVELHGGTVSVASRGKDQGTVFIITLPLITVEKSAPAARQNVDQTPLETAGSTSGVCVLLVEDDEDSREMLSVMFEQSGIKVYTANTAVKALESVQKILPDVLISDIGLPGENGYELISKVRMLSPAQGGLTPAIALTGYVSLQDRSLALDGGFQEHLSKPVDIDKLLAIVEKLASGNKFAEAE